MIHGVWYLGNEGQRQKTVLIVINYVGTLISPDLYWLFLVVLHLLLVT